MESSEFINITEDGGILKKILVPSSSSEHPQKGQKVEGTSNFPLPLLKSLIIQFFMLASLKMALHLIPVKTKKTLFLS
jgi:hypothetical protein